MRWLVAAALLAACGGDKDPPSIPDSAMAADADGIDAAPPRETKHESQPLLVGQLVEFIMHGGADDYVQLHFDAPAMSLSWNLHAHQDGGTQVVYEELNQTTVDYAFHPAFEADWYLLLRNDGLTDITVDVTAGLYGDMTWTAQ